MQVESPVLTEHSRELSQSKESGYFRAALHCSLLRLLSWEKLVSFLRPPQTFFPVVVEHLCEMMSTNQPWLFHSEGMWHQNKTFVFCISGKKENPFNLLFNFTGIIFDVRQCHLLLLSRENHVSPEQHFKNYLLCTCLQTCFLATGIRYILYYVIVNETDINCWKQTGHGHSPYIKQYKGLRWRGHIQEVGQTDAETKHSGL